MVSLTRKQIQDRLCAMMYKLDKSGKSYTFAPSKSLKDDLDFLDLLLSYTLLDLEARAREAKAGGKK